MHSSENKETLTVFCSQKIGSNLLKYIPSLFKDIITFIPNQTIGLSISLALIKNGRDGVKREVDPGVICRKNASIFCSLRQTLPKTLIKIIEEYHYHHACNI